jgi:hypothetical protein
LQHDLWHHDDRDSVAGCCGRQHEQQTLATAGPHDDHDPGLATDDGI